MRRQTLSLGVVLLAALFTLPAFGGREFYSLSRSIRALGMGGAFYGLSDDENAVFYNPAGLGFYEGGKDLMLSLKVEGSGNVPAAIQTLISAGNRSVAAVIADLQQYQGNPITGGITPLYAYYLRKYFSAGLLIADTKAAVSLLGADLDTTADVTVISDSGVFIGAGFPVVEGLSVGANVKALFRAGGQRTYTVLEIAQNTGFSGDISTLGGMGGGVDFDLGVTYQLPTFCKGVVNRVSLVANNLLGSPFTLFRMSGYGPPPGLPRLLTVAGYTRLPGFGAVDHVNLLLDFAEFQIGGESNVDYGARTGSLWKHINLGAEARLFGWLTGRIGLRQGNPTFGLSLDGRFFQLDLSTYAEELANLPGRLTSRRFALRLAAGLGGADPTVASATALGTQPALPPPPLDSMKSPEEVKPDPSKTLELMPSEKGGEPHGKRDRLGVETLSEVSLRQ
jgi:hypothetical protein